MEFIIIAKDGTDAQALERRMAAREGHIAHSNNAAKSGEQIMAAAMLDESEKMNGSVMVVNFDDRPALDAWLKVESYVTGNVWQDIQVIPCKLAPAFAKD